MVGCGRDVRARAFDFREEADQGSRKPGGVNVSKGTAGRGRGNVDTSLPVCEAHRVRRTNDGDSQKAFGVETHAGCRMESRLGLTVDVWVVTCSRGTCVCVGGVWRR